MCRSSMRRPLSGTWAKSIRLSRKEGTPTCLMERSVSFGRRCSIDRSFRKNGKRSSRRAQALSSLSGRREKRTLSNFTISSCTIHYLSTPSLDRASNKPLKTMQQSSRPKSPTSTSLVSWTSKQNTRSSCKDSKNCNQMSSSSRSTQPSCSTNSKNPINTWSPIPSKTHWCCLTRILSPSSKTSPRSRRRSTRSRRRVSGGLKVSPLLGLITTSSHVCISALMRKRTKHRLRI